MAKNGFSSEEQRKTIQKRYEKTAKGKLARERTKSKNGTKKFIEKFATEEELEMLLEKIEERFKVMRIGGEIEMKVHKEIIVDMKKMKEILKDDGLVERAQYLIEDYNTYKSTEIEFTFSWNLNKCREWGYDYGGDIESFDKFFVETLGMKESVKRAWDNKTAQKYYYFED